MDRKSPRPTPSERIENLRRRLDELARQLGGPQPRRVTIPIPVDRP